MYKNTDVIELEARCSIFARIQAGTLFRIKSGRIFIAVAPEDSQSWRVVELTSINRQCIAWELLPFRVTKLHFRNMDSLEILFL